MSQVPRYKDWDRNLPYCMFTNNTSIDEEWSPTPDRSVLGVFGCGSKPYILTGLSQCGMLPYLALHHFSLFPHFLFILLRYTNVLIFSVNWREDNSRSHLTLNKVLEEHWDRCSSLLHMVRPLNHALNGGDDPQILEYYCFCHCFYCYFRTLVRYLKPVVNDVGSSFEYRPCYPLQDMEFSSLLLRL